MNDPMVSGLILYIYIMVMLLVCGVLDILARMLERWFERRELQRSGKSHGLSHLSNSARWGQRSHVR